MFENAESLTLKGKALKSLTVGGAVIWKKKVKVSRLPAGYQEVEYIANTAANTAYINTGIQTQANIGVKFSVMYSGTSAQRPMGARRTSSNSLFIPGLYNGGKISIAYGNKAETSFSSAVTGKALNTKYETSLNYLNDGKAVFDGTTMSSAILDSNTFTTPYNIYLFAVNGAGSLLSNAFVGRLYETILSVGASLVADFVPCYKTDTGEIGMYDIVRNAFYGNVGSGSFTKGADV